MSDSPQATQFPQGISSPSVTGLGQVVFNDGLALNTTPVPVSLSLGSSNVGVFSFVIANGSYINGKYIVKFSVGGGISVVMLDVSAQSYVGAASVANTINVTSVGDSDKTICYLKSASIVKNTTSNDMAIELSFVLNCPSFSAGTVVVDSIGNSAPINITAAITSWNSSASFKYTDSRDILQVYSQRANGNGVSLNSITTPGMVSCNPTDVASRPSGSNGIGTCLVTSSGDTTLQLTQQFTDSQTQKIYTRCMSSDGVTWGSWIAFLTQADVSSIVGQNSTNSLLESIVFG